MRVSVNNGALMHDAGFDVVYVSDHPALNGQYLLREAAAAHNFGLPTKPALASLFSVPARTIGLDDRIGYLREGYDADLVVWDDHPLQLSAAVLQVWIDGVDQVKGGGTENSSMAWRNAKVRDAPAQRGMSKTTPSECTEGATDFVIHGVNGRLHPSGGIDTSGSVVIRDGRIICVGECLEELYSSPREFTLNLTEGFLLPVSPIHVHANKQGPHDPHPISRPDRNTYRTTDLRRLRRPVKLPPNSRKVRSVPFRDTCRESEYARYINHHHTSSSAWSGGVLSERHWRFHQRGKYGFPYGYQTR